jgi:hypothetical protein
LEEIVLNFLLYFSIFMAYQSAKRGDNVALFDNGFKIGTPILLGVGALILAPMIIPAAASILKPLAKATVKSGLLLVHRGRELIAETAEALEDITAEVRAELIAERAGPTENPEAEGIS